MSEDRITTNFLLQLPDELLVAVFDYVGPQFFRLDLGRLTICKQWCKLAVPVCYSDFYGNQHTIEKFVAFENLYRNQLLLQHNIRSFTLNLDEDTFTRQFGFWEQMDRNLAFLASLLKDSSHLCTVHFKGARLLFAPHAPHTPFPIYRNLTMSTMRAFLSVESLSVLELDMCAPSISHGYHRVDEAPADHAMLCEIIAQCLPKLHSLRLRLLTICPKILKLAPQQKELRLVEVLINLSLTLEEDPERGGPISARCDSFRPQPYVTVKTALKRQAQVLVSQMVAPKMVRIIYHSQRHPDGFRAYDALTDSNLRIDAAKAWDDEGESVGEDSEDEEYDSNLSDSSFDSEYDAYLQVFEEGSVSEDEEEEEEES